MSPFCLDFTQQQPKSQNHHLLICYSFWAMEKHTLFFLSVLAFLPRLWHFLHFMLMLFFLSLDPSGKIFMWFPSFAFLSVIFIFFMFAMGNGVKFNTFLIRGTFYFCCWIFLMLFIFMICDRYLYDLNCLKLKIHESIIFFELK